MGYAHRETFYDVSGHKGWVNTIAFSPDGSTFAAGGGENAIVLWDVRTGERLATLEGHASIVLCVAFSPDGLTIASGGWYRDHTVRLWDVSTGEHLRTFEGHTSRFGTYRFLPMG